jgi:Oxidoreductase molybdopterin binding domain
MRLSDVSRRNFIKVGSLGAAATSVEAGHLMGQTVSNDANSAISAEKLVASKLKSFITPLNKFVDVSRGDPKPHQLSDEQRIEAGLTQETWKLEITADPFVELPHTKVPAIIEKSMTITDGTAIDFPALVEMGKEHAVHYFKAMQCLNIQTPLGQGLWTGVPLRTVLKLCGKLQNVRRIYYWGFHNHDSKQIFKSSVSYSQCMEIPPGELPVFLAYKLNGKPISPERGGPVRVIVPWSHGYKSIKWLQHIFLTNDARNNDTYASGNNDPDSVLKTAAYVDSGAEQINKGEPIVLTGQVIVGPSGVQRVEYWVREVTPDSKPLDDDAVEILKGPWFPCNLVDPPHWESILPDNLKPNQLLGFNPSTGTPLQWPMKYSMCQYTAVIHDLPVGKYEVRARSVDLNGFAQPEPRPLQKSGKNALQLRRFEVV